jgi:outer membrane protein OmpA-like peptidoglycan-associated protein
MLVAVTLAGSSWAQKDVAGSKDHPLLTRMPGSIITSYEQKDFDSVDQSTYLSGADARWDGRTTRLRYATAEAKRPTMVQIERNYEAALKKVGAKVLSSDDRVLLAKLEKGGATTWVFEAAYNEGAEYELIIVEHAAMAQDVVADAAALAKGLVAEGRVALYGLYFDTGKAVVKPESAPTLEQIVKLLQADPKLQLFVVGHTDGVGQLESNLKLSNDRAAAVVKELAAKGIDAKRLKPAGVGPWSPVASNRSEEGRAKNRRVELVDRP